MVSKISGCRIGARLGSNHTEGDTLLIKRQTANFTSNESVVIKALRLINIKHVPSSTVLNYGLLRCLKTPLVQVVEEYIDIRKEGKKQTSQMCAPWLCLIDKVVTFSFSIFPLI